MARRAIGLLIASAMIQVCFLTSTAEACSCYGMSPCAAYEWAKVVFVGKMVGGSERNPREDRYGNSVMYEAGYARFEIEEAFKGIVGKEVTIFIDTEKNSSCAWSGYLPGARYLVFASEYNGKLVIGACNPTKMIRDEYPEKAREPNFSRRYSLWNAQTGLKFLRSLSTTGTSGRLYVTVKMTDEETSIRDAAILVKGQGNLQYETVTDEYGEAVIDNLPPGKYTVTSSWPKGIIGWHQPEIEITERCCSELKAIAFHSGVISGRVLDSKGQPAQSVTVYACSADNQEKRAGSFTTKENGTFEISNIPQGKYHLYFQTSREDKSPYFYPGVFDKAKATTITIEMGEKSEELEFKLPSAFERQTIKGKVVMPDGKPVAKAWVYLRCPTEIEAQNLKVKIPEVNSETDSEGNFTITGFKGVSYSLKVVVKTGDPNITRNKDHLHAPLVRLVLGEELIELRLVLSESGYGPDCDDDKGQRGQN